jgi:hypothetical protein
VAHAYNLSYSGIRDQKDHDSKPIWANSSRGPILKKALHKKRCGGVDQAVCPEFKTQYHKNISSGPQYDMSYKNVFKGLHSPLVQWSVL